MSSSFQVLSERDYLNLIELIHKLEECETQSDLEGVVRTHLFPLFQIEAFGSATLAANPENPSASTLTPIATAGYSPQEIEWAFLCQPYMEDFTRLYATGMRAVLATGTDLPGDTLSNSLHRFFEDHPEIDPNDAPTLKNMSGHLSIVNGPEASLTVGLSRVRNDKPFTYRELRMAELAQPSLLHACQYVALRRDLHHFSALADHLADTSTPIALVQPEGRILFCNGSFQKRFQLQQGERLPEEIREWIQKQDDLYSPAERLDELSRFSPFYKHKKEVYRLNLTRLDPLQDYDNRCYLLQFKSALGPQSRVGVAMDEARLTAREIEVASLVCDGFSDKEIAERLFISPNTVNNHLKRIFKKMGVHTRVQLLHHLQGIMKGRATQ
ncbi:helix-turn-helix transcriptional regulator [Nitrospina gracilis]|uniref:helix-turn-helix transcriptional regulator n=1 Tax=Nitrospina gracilis TaxID=35801 RepID=UPI001F026428|nr:LuxR C-terminal-related transcriptional regulator [Nitrospina gracilis]MCF8719459.1 DNA-binding CsgD family transcriptional regulator [Nitrospina gracilis Nb-211]